MQARSMTVFGLLMVAGVLGSGCGSGVPPVTTAASVVVTPHQTTVGLGGTVAFTAAVTGATSGVTWSVQEAGGGAVDGSGKYTAPAKTGTFHVVATSVADTPMSDAAIVTVTSTTVVAVSVSPHVASVLKGGAVPFTATVTGTSAGQSTAVTWSVQEAAGGTVDSSGYYVAPGTTGTYHVVATSVADTSKKDTATVTVTTTPVIVVSISPQAASVVTGGTAPFTATVTGTTAGQSTAVTWSVQEAGGGTVSAVGVYTAPGTAGTYHVVATSVADTSKKGTATVTATPPPPIAVSVSPGGASTPPGGTATFTATVTGTTAGQSTAVTWSVQEAGGGTVSAAGVYTAPGTAGTYHVVATSVADTSKTGTANVFVTTLTAIPPERITVWNPGVPGGILVRTTVCATISASTYGNGTTDAAAAINSALAACPSGQVVMLPAGTYLVKSPIQLFKSNVVLRGAGTGQTKIKLDPVAGQVPVIQIGVFWPTYNPAVNVVGGLAKGAVSIPVQNASGFAAGDIAQIDQLDDTSYVLRGDNTWYKRGPTSNVYGPASSGGYRSVGQQIEIGSISGNTLTITTPLHIKFDAAFSPQVFLTNATSIGNRVDHSGVEHLYVTGGLSGNIDMLNCAYSWVLDVESDGNPATGSGMTGIHISVAHGFRNEIRQVYVHHATDINPGGTAYGVALTSQSSENLVEDSIMWYLNKPLSTQASGGGNVLAYNYVDDAIIAAQPWWQETSIDGSHASFSHFELFEGNWTPNLSVDTTHGNAGWHTFFRNYATGINAPPSTATDSISAVNIHGWHREMTVVGNVLLQGKLVIKGFQPVYESSNANFSSTADAAAAYRIGNDADPSLGYGSLDDGTALRLLFRHGNYDAVTDGVVWDPSVSSHDLPPSLYQTAKPAFMGSELWPFVDPTRTPRVGVLPAKKRFDAMPSH